MVHGRHGRSHANHPPFRAFRVFRGPPSRPCRFILQRDRTVVARSFRRSWLGKCRQGRGDKSPQGKWGGFAVRRRGCPLREQGFARWKNVTPLLKIRCPPRNTQVCRGQPRARRGIPTFATAYLASAPDNLASGLENPDPLLDNPISAMQNPVCKTNHTGCPVQNPEASAGRSG